MRSNLIFGIFLFLAFSSVAFAACSARITVRDGSWAVLPSFNDVSMTCDATCTSCYIDGVSGSDLSAKIDYTDLDAVYTDNRGVDFFHQMGTLKLRNKSFLTYYKLSLYDTFESKAVDNATVIIYRNGTTDVVWSGTTFKQVAHSSADQQCDDDTDEGGFAGGNAYFILDARDSYDINIKHPIYSKVKVKLVGYDADAYSGSATVDDNYGTGDSDTSGTTSFWFLDHDISTASGITFNLNSLGMSAYDPQSLAALQPTEMDITVKDPSRGTVCSGKVDEDGQWYCNLLSHRFDYDDETVLNYDVDFVSSKYATLNAGNSSPFTGITVPNTFRFGSDVTATKPFKMIQKTELDLNNDTYVWLIFPPKSSEYEVNFTDYIDPNFAFASSVSITRKSSYSPNSCVVTPSTSSWTANSGNCGMLADTTNAGDWYLVSYLATAPGTPAYYTFPSNGEIHSKTET